MATDIPRTTIITVKRPFFIKPYSFISMVKPSARQGCRRWGRQSCHRLWLSEGSFQAALGWQPGDSQLVQDGHHRAPVGKSGLQQVQTDKTGEPEPVRVMEMGQQQ